MVGALLNRFVRGGNNRKNALILFMPAPDNWQQIGNKKRFLGNLETV
jgi:hypothetical protein